MPERLAGCPRCPFSRLMLAFHFRRPTVPAVHAPTHLCCAYAADSIVLPVSIVEYKPVIVSGRRLYICGEEGRDWTWACTCKQSPDCIHVRAMANADLRRLIHDHTRNVLLPSGTRPALPCIQLFSSKNRRPGWAEGHGERRHGRDRKTQGHGGGGGGGGRGRYAD